MWIHVQGTVVINKADFLLNTMSYTGLSVIAGSFITDSASKKQVNMTPHTNNMHFLRLMRLICFSVYNSNTAVSYMESFDPQFPYNTNIAERRDG